MVESLLKKKNLEYFKKLFFFNCKINKKYEASQKIELSKNDRVTRMLKLTKIKLAASRLTDGRIIAQGSSNYLGHFFKNNTNEYNTRFLIKNQLGQNQLLFDPENIWNNFVGIKQERLSTFYFINRYPLAKATGKVHSARRRKFRRTEYRSFHVNDLIFRMWINRQYSISNYYNRERRFFFFYAEEFLDYSKKITWYGKGYGDFISSLPEAFGVASTELQFLIHRSKKLFKKLLIELITEKGFFEKKPFTLIPMLFLSFSENQLEYQNKFKLISLPRSFEIETPFTYKARKFGRQSIKSQIYTILDTRDYGFKFPINLRIKKAQYFDKSSGEYFKENFYKISSNSSRDPTQMYYHDWWKTISLHKSDVGLNRHYALFFSTDNSKILSKKDALFQTLFENKKFYPIEKISPSLLKGKKAEQLLVHHFLSKKKKTTPKKKKKNYTKKKKKKKKQPPKKKKVIMQKKKSSSNFSKKLFYRRTNISEKLASYTRLDENFIKYRRYLKLKNTFFDKLILKKKFYYSDKRIPLGYTKLSEVSDWDSFNYAYFNLIRKKKWKKYQKLTPLTYSDIYEPRSVWQNRFLRNFVEKLLVQFKKNSAAEYLRKWQDFRYNSQGKRTIKALKEGKIPRNSQFSFQENNITNYLNFQEKKLFFWRTYLGARVQSFQKQLKKEFVSNYKPLRRRQFYVGFAFKIWRKFAHKSGMAYFGYRPLYKIQSMSKSKQKRPFYYGKAGYRANLESYAGYFISEFIYKLRLAPTYRSAKEAVATGLVFVDGRVFRDPNRQVPVFSTIQYKGDWLRTYILNLVNEPDSTFSPYPRRIFYKNSQIFLQRGWLPSYLEVSFKLEEAIVLRKSFRLEQPKPYAIHRFNPLDFLLSRAGRQTSGIF